MQGPIGNGGFGYADVRREAFLRPDVQDEAYTTMEPQQV